ncbi:polysaccharide deacetylase family protein [Leptospira sp. GIMC2001]|uniref:polysaccharide deacetylase family protein n=1 Tax=Leptospira sp. GIMC2001 TaxID=1513297 RepID=UPI00234B7A0B|nr:polysaccharide deacetylase family protein [Leptospira sp. GIMC2001]WCL48142.1 polysaccharide deacetylase family protein [Leptospira sp. GIMC2001]
MEEEKVQDLVNELSQDISRDDQFRQRVKRLILRTTIILVLIFLSTIGAYLLYLKFSLSQIEQELKLKQNTIDDLESSLNSLMYAEQIREEESLRIREGGDWAEDRETNQLEKKVLKNLQFLEAAAKDSKGNNISRGNEKFPEIALTFDLATGNELSTIENLIKKYNIKVTIFLSNERPSDTTGSFFMSSNIRYIKKMAKSNKVEFANHTWSHFNYVRSVHETSPKRRKVLDYVSKDAMTLERMAEELYRVETKYLDITGDNLTKFYRLPYGAVNTLILNSHASIGYKDHIMWSKNSVGSLDLPDYIHKQFITKISEKGKPTVVKNPFYKTGREALDFLYKWENRDSNGMNGAILLMHLGSPRKFDKLIDILPEFIETMKKKGYSFVTVSEVLNDKQD